MEQNNKRKALGKGLEQLFSNESLYVDPLEEIVENAKEEDIVELKLSELRSNPYQPRTTFDQEKLMELADSIKEFGVLEPIIVTKGVKGYEIVAGERRKKASELAGLETIPAIIKEFTDEEMMQIALLENIQREDLSAIEEAQAYSKLLKGLLRLPESAKKDILDGYITMGHAKVLSKIEDSEQILYLVDKIKKDHISVRTLEELANNPVYKRKNEIVKVKPVNTYGFVEDALTDTIGNKVKIKNKKIVIPFTNDKDLERILEILKIEVKVD